MTGKKKFKGKDRTKLVDEMDQWLENNKYSLYGSKAIVAQQTNDGQWEMTVTWQGADEI